MRFGIFQHASINSERFGSQANAGTGISNKLDARLLEGAPDFIDSLEMRADGGALQSFKTADRGNCDPGPNRELVLLPSDKRSRGLYLTRYDEHRSATTLQHLDRALPFERVPWRDWPVAYVPELPWNIRRGIPLCHYLLTTTAGMGCSFTESLKISGRA